MEPCLVPYDSLEPGIEAIYTGKPFTEGKEDWPLRIRSDGDGREVAEWDLHPWAWPGHVGGLKAERRLLDELQVKLGPISDETRKIRAHIASFVPCDNGLPMTIDELLLAIGRGSLPEVTYHNGCMLATMWWEGRTTQPGQTEAMRIIEAVLQGYLAGRTQDDLLGEYPDATGFIKRTYGWFGDRSEFTQLQQKMLERALLPFKFFSKHNDDRLAVHNNCFVEGGQGPELDGEIAGLAGLPEIAINDYEKFKANYDSLEGPLVKQLYRVCCRIACGVSELSDCHHNTFRIIESWIHGIGLGSPEIDTRLKGTERKRVGQLLFGYTLGLDVWLSGKLKAFVELGFGHVDLGFNPRNEIQRVYAYLGDKGPTKEWLAASFWYNLRYNRPAGLERHKYLLELAAKAGLSFRSWIDRRLAGSH